MALLEVENIKKAFSGGARAVDGVSFSILEHETLGIVGESGSGKSTLGRLLLRLLEPSEGFVKFEGVDLARLSPKELRAWRSKAQIIFQNPFDSLNPRQKIRDVLTEAVTLHSRHTRNQTQGLVAGLMDQVGLNSDSLACYPHEFSGGQRQRIAIARAIAVGPKFIVADEPVSALDLSIQAQILELLTKLKETQGLSYLFISHDLRVVEYMADRIAVMYQGKLMELLPALSFRERARHPYTRALIQSLPSLDPKERKENAEGITLPTHLSVDRENGSDRVSGCVYQFRCPFVEERCKNELPAFRPLGQEHKVACHIL